MAKRGGLGRGLDALIPNREAAKKETSKSTDTENKSSSGKKATTEKTTAHSGAENADRAGSAAKKSSDEAGVKQNDVVSMRISLVEPNREQPRKFFDEQAITELADSVKQFGIIQPLLVQKKDDYYEIIAGERRWRAAQKAGLKEVPVIVRNFSSQEAVEVSLIENIQREDLNPIEEAKAYERLVREYGLSQEEVSQRVSKSRSAVTNSMRLLKLEDSVQRMVETSELSEGHARAILGIADPSMQKTVAENVIKEHLSVRQTEKLVRESDQGKKKKAAKKVNALDEVLLQDLSEKLKQTLGTKVNIIPKGKSGGKIEIEYYSTDDLDRLYEMLRSVH